MVLGVRLSHLSGRDVLVHTLDISSSGAKLGALREVIEPGTVLTVQRKHVRTQCAVVWSRQVTTSEMQLGIEFLGQGSQLWGLDLDDHNVGVWLSAAER